MATRTAPPRLFALAVLAFFAALAFQRPAFAGTLQIRDEAHVLAAGDAERLKSAVSTAPFDARLVLSSDYPEPQDLSRFVGSLIDEPNMVAVGVDPKHRHVQVHFGRGTGIEHSEWAAIETAGNGAFRNGDWAEGSAAIFRTAAQSVTGTVASPANAPHALGVGKLVMILLVVGGGVALIGFLARRFRSGPYNGPGYGGPGYGGYGGGPYAGPPYGPQGGMGPVGGGLIGAGLGGLAGYELGKLEGEREQRGGGYDDRAGVARDENYDAGGGGSSWEDAGGGSGDDSGGGFDGGGGGDGGGSDF
jgi:hypothetical protein